MGKTNYDIVQANSFVDSDGDPIGGTSLPDPLYADGVIGTDIATADATATASTETVDPDEFAAVVALVNACKAKLNSILVTE
jgi:hypothetical protein